MHYHSKFEAVKKKTCLLWIYSEETEQPVEGYYNGNSTRQADQRQDEDFMGRYHYVVDWDNDR